MSNHESIFAGRLNRQPVAKAFLGILEYHLREDFTSSFKEHRVVAYATLAGLMIEAAES